jgi:chaperonin GroEL
VCDAGIDSILQIEQVLKPIVANQKKLLIIAPTSTNFLNTIAANVVKNKVRICVIEPPSFGYKQHEIMQDIALSLGATYYSEKTGDDLSLITEQDLGFAKKIIVGRTSTIVVKDPDNPNQAEVDERVEQLWKQHKVSKKKEDRIFLESRIASLVGGVGVIYAGGATDIEQKEKFDRIEDAVCAVKASLESGILPGAGNAIGYYSRYAETTHNKRFAEDYSDEQLAAIDVMEKATMAPYIQILENAGHDWKAVYATTKELSPNLNGKVLDMGFDVNNGKYTSLYKAGIVDPAQVSISALTNATSVALTICSTNAIVTLARTYESNG